MKWFWGTVWTAILGALSALLVVTFQDRVKDAFDGTNLSADIYTAPWQPLASEARGDLLASSDREGMGSFERERLLEPGATPMVMVRLHNSGISPTENVRLQFPSSGGVVGTVLRTSDDAERTYTSSLENLDIGVLDAGETAYVYFWAPYEFDFGYRLDRIRIFTESERFSVKVHEYEVTADYLYDEPLWFDLISEYSFVAFVILVVIVIALTILMIAAWTAYVKRILDDEDFYLAERIRYEADKIKFQPDFKEINPG